MSYLLALDQGTSSSRSIVFDQDGRVDIQKQQFKTNPNLPDSDGDGYVDGLEIKHGFDPLSVEEKKLTKSILIDLKKQEL